MMIGLGSGPCILFNRPDLLALGFSAYGVDALERTIPPGGVAVNGTVQQCIPDWSAIPDSYVQSHTLQPAAPPPTPAAMAPVPASSLPVLTAGAPIVIGNSGSPIAPAVLTPGPSYTVTPLPPAPSAFPTTPAPSAPAPQAPMSTTPLSSNSGQSVASGAPATSSGLPATIFGINSTYVLIGGGALVLLLMMGKK